MRAFYFALIFKASAAEEHAALAQLAQLGQYAQDLAELTFTRKVQKKKMLKKYEQLIADQEELYNRFVTYRIVISYPMEGKMVCRLRNYFKSL